MTTTILLISAIERSAVAGSWKIATRWSVAVRVKALFLVVCLLPLTLVAQAEPAAIAPAGFLEQLSRLKTEFELRRAEVLRPVTLWYQVELEALQRSHSDKAVITQELAVARETFWQDDQPELRRALLADAWLWRSADDPEGVETVFRSDGAVEHVGMRGQWRITGPCEVTIQTAGQERFVLRFNASLSLYEGDRRNVSGRRIVPAPDR